MELSGNAGTYEEAEKQVKDARGFLNALVEES